MVMSVVDSPMTYQPAFASLSTQTFTSPDRTNVYDTHGVLAVLTNGAKTVAVRGQNRTFTEQKRPFTDNFVRTTTNGLGQSPGGGLWSNVTGTDAKFSTNGSQGLILMDVANTSRHCSIKDDRLTDVDVTVKVTMTVAPAGASSSIGLSFCYADSSNMYRARLLFGTAGSVQLALEKEVAGVVTNLGALTSVGTGFVANQMWHIRAQKTGILLKAKAWKDGDAEPGTWLHSVSDSTFATGRVGIRSLASTSSTSIPYNTVIDDLQVISGRWDVAPTITHNFWVRTLSTPFNGTFTQALSDQINRWAYDNSPDVLSYCMMFGQAAPPVTDPVLSAQVFGETAYGPLQPDGTRYEASDFNDYMGIGWTFPSGEVRTFPHGSITISGVMDCSGFVRMVYGYRMGIPLTYHLNYDGINIPRATADMSPNGPGVIVSAGTGAPPDMSRLQIGDVVFFDADMTEPVEGQIDHCGIFMGIDVLGDYRFISSRKTVNGATFADLGGNSTLNGTSTYATRFRTIRRF